MTHLTPSRPAAGILLVAGIALLAWCGTWRAHAASKAEGGFTGVGDGYQLPAFQITDLTGQPHTLSQYKDQVLVLHFWATWCPYCRKEVDKLIQLVNDYRAKGVRVLAISSDEQPGALQAFIAEHKLPYPVAADLQGERSVFAQYGVSGIPVTLIVARDGRIAERLNGSSDIIGAVERALQ